MLHRQPIDPRRDHPVRFRDSLIRALLQLGRTRLLAFRPDREPKYPWSNRIIEPHPRGLVSAQGRMLCLKAMLNLQLMARHPAISRDTRSVLRLMCDQLNAAISSRTARSRCSNLKQRRWRPVTVRRHQSKSNLPNYQAAPHTHLEMQESFPSGTVPQLLREA